MSVSSPVMPRPETPSSTVTPRLPGSLDTLDDEQLKRWVWEGSEPAPTSPTGNVDDQPQQSVVEGLEPSPSSRTGKPYKADCVLMAAVFAIIFFLWMQ
jgi:hypothetical protein